MKVPGLLYREYELRFELEMIWFSMSVLIWGRCPGSLN